MDWEVKREQFLKRMQRAVNRLSQKERQILVMLYMQNEEIFYGIV
ncbi:ArpU family transcriptional regulator [Bacillus sp. CN2]|nr:ArpU family transcriptional regulator [Bacillus velezensis]ARZ59568.1 ArpU family transcriptional regulator [Bacillus velezensis]GFR54643.1 ArpU family transcriptional regulator [Bacillus sp. CN2]